MTADAHAEFRDLIPAYALGSLDADEAGDVARHLAGCSSCRSELDAFGAVVDALALAAPNAAPSPEVRRRLLATAAADKATHRVNAADRAATADNPLETGFFGKNSVSKARSPVGTGFFGKNPVPKRPAWASLALIALVVAIVGGLIWSAVGRSPARPLSIALFPSDDASDATGELRFDGRAATLEVKGLPLLTAEQQYQLWLVHDGERDSGAVFSVNDNGWAEVPVEIPRSPGDSLSDTLGVSLSDYTNLWISIEPAGGSPDPTGEWVLEWGSD